eukprot:3676491-Heterocapsa_arctica.AAC.2
MPTAIQRQAARACDSPARVTLFEQRLWDREGSDDESSGDDPGGEEAGDIYVGYLLDLLYTGVISAKDACQLCYRAHKSGAAPNVGIMGYPPNKSSGHYQSHIDRLLETRMQKEWYTVAVPGHNNHDQSRNVQETP